MPQPTWEQIERFIGTTGLAVFLIVMAVLCFVGTVVPFCVWGVRAAWSWLKPWLERMFASQIAMYDSITASCQRQPLEHRRVMRGQGCLGRLILAKSPEERQAYFDELRREIQSAESVCVPSGERAAGSSAAAPEG